MLVVKRLHDKQETGQEMYNLARNYHTDIDAFEVNGQPLSKIPFPQYFDIIRAIPFRQDTTGIEVVSRPFHLFSTPFNGWDCKKKGIALASWLESNNIPWRFVAVSRRPNGDIHHVITQANLNGAWHDIDATYRHNDLYRQQAWTNQEPLSMSGNDVEIPAAPVLVSMYGQGDPNPATAAEFNHKIRQMYPQLLGSGIVAGIIAGVGAITATIIGAVAGKRRHDRQMEYDQMIIEAQTQYQQDQATSRAAEAGEQVEKITDLTKKFLVPGAIAAGLIFFAQ